MIGPLASLASLTTPMECTMKPAVPLWPRLTLALALAGACANPAWAQATAPAPVLKSNQVTEDALVDALAVDVPEPAEGASGATAASGRPPGPVGPPSSPPRPARPSRRRPARPTC